MSHLKALQGHTDRVNSVCFSPDGKMIATGSGFIGDADNTIRLWNAATGKRLRTLRGHMRSVNSICFSPDGKTLATGSWDGTILLWDMPLIRVKVRLGNRTYRAWDENQIKEWKTEWL